MLNKIIHGDCLEVMKDIPDKSVDMILCDLPYGNKKTAYDWDSIIPYDLLWEQYERIIKDNGAIVLTANQPFTSTLIMSNRKLFRYCWIWDKVLHSSPLHAKRQPLRIYEDICVFSKKPTIYNPQMRQGEPYKKGDKVRENKRLQGNQKLTSGNNKTGLRYPVNIIKFSNASKKGIKHPTQKPVSLFEYLLLTYTNEGDVVLDNCIGSGTTAIAAINTSRNYIGIEKDWDYCEIANERVEEHKKNISLVRSTFIRYSATTLKQLI